MAYITESVAALLDPYRNERRIELAFEDHRYFDVRRWMIAPQAYEDAKGVNIGHKIDASSNVSCSTYSVISAQGRAWNPLLYPFPISLDEMNRNDKLVQNPLY